jgi:hypothetical protein
LVVPILSQMTMIHGPLLNIFEFAHNLPTDFRPVPRLYAFSRCSAAVSGVKRCYLISSSLGSWPGALPAVRRTSSRLLNCRALTCYASLGPCAALDARPIGAKSRRYANRDVAF